MSPLIFSWQLLSEENLRMNNILACVMVRTPSQTPDITFAQFVYHATLPDHPDRNFDWDDEGPVDYHDSRLLRIYVDYGHAYLFQASVCTNVTVFGGSEDLSDRFFRWQSFWDQFDHWLGGIDYTSQIWRDWDAEGLALAGEFRTVLAPEYTLWYFPWMGEGVIEVKMD